MAPLGHGVHGIANQVGEDLAQLAGKAEKIDIRPTFARNLDLLRLQPPGIDRHHRIDQLPNIGDLGQGRLTVKAQGLLRHFRDARNFLLRQDGVPGRLRIQRRLVPQQVQQIGDCLQRIIDLMRDGSRKAASGSKFLCLSQCVF